MLELLTASGKSNPGILLSSVVGLYISPQLDSFSLSSLASLYITSILSPLELQSLTGLYISKLPDGVNQ